MLGARLLDRLGRRVAPTEAGRIVAEHATRLFATLASAREAVADLGGLRRGSLRVGASTTPGIYVLPAMIAAFEQRYPGIALTLTIANSAGIEERIRANELDLGVVGGHGLRAGEECVSAGLGDELVLIVAPTHPWASRREIRAEHLADQRLLIREEGSATRQVMERALQHAGARLGRVMELGHTEAIKQAVMVGLGVAFVSVHAVRNEVGGRAGPRPPPPGARDPPPLPRDPPRRPGARRQRACLHRIPGGLPPRPAGGAPRSPSPAVTDPAGGAAPAPRGGSDLSPAKIPPPSKWLICRS